MAEPNGTESPLEAAAEVAGPRATEAFSLLANEKRLAILLALWEAFEPFAEGTWDPTEGNAVPFTELRERVGIRDPGQFNYHLGELVGEFVDRTAEGYQLLPAGNTLVRTVIASAGFEEPVLEPTELDLACSICGAPTAVTYQHQRVYQVCTACDGAFPLGEKHPPRVVAAWIANPTILIERTPEETFAANLNEVSHMFGRLTGGICHECSGQVDSRFDICDDHDPGGEEPCPACGRHVEQLVRFACTTCKQTSQSDIAFLSFNHPVVGTFAWKHGIDLGYGRWDMETVRWVYTLWENAEVELVSTAPPRVRVTLRHEGETVQLTFDEELTVVDIGGGD